VILYLAAPLAALVLAVTGLRFGVPAYHHHKHARCLANIELLEIELGIRPPKPSFSQAVLKSQAWQAEAYARQQITQRSMPPRYRDDTNEQIEANRREAERVARYYGWTTKGHVKRRKD